MLDPSCAISRTSLVPAYSRSMREPSDATSRTGLPRLSRFIEVHEIRSKSSSFSPVHT